LQVQGLSVDYAFTQGGGSDGPSHRLSADYAFGPQAGGPEPQPTPSQADRVGVTLTADLQLSLSAEPALFNPNRGQTLLLRATASGKAASSYIEIKPLSGPAVAAQRAEGIAKSFKWDGKRPGGGDAAPG